MTDDKSKEIKNNEVKEKSRKKPATSEKKTKEQKKIKTLDEKILALVNERDQLKDQSLRKMAEFENYKRRTEKEFLAVLENANETLITELLPAVDDFERFLDHADNDENNASLKDGISLVYKKIMDIFAKKGLKVMESVGQEFDADRHDALVQVDSDTYESGFVAGEHLKGYVLNDKVIRHAQVMVAK